MVREGGGGEKMKRKCCGYRMGLSFTKKKLAPDGSVKVNQFYYCEICKEYKVRVRIAFGK